MDGADTLVHHGQRRLAGVDVLLDLRQLVLKPGQVGQLRLLGFDVVAQPVAQGFLVLDVRLGVDDLQRQVLACHLFGGEPGVNLGELSRQAGLPRLQPRRRDAQFQRLVVGLGLGIGVRGQRHHLAIGDPGAVAGGLIVAEQVVDAVGLGGEIVAVVIGQLRQVRGLGGIAGRCAGLNCSIRRRAAGRSTGRRTGRSGNRLGTGVEHQQGGQQQKAFPGLDHRHHVLFT